MVNTGSTAQHAPNQGRLPIRKAIARYDLLSNNGTHRAPLIEESAGLLRGTILANQKHLRMLQRGAHNWNAWRKANRSVQPDLRDADLSNAHLRDADLSNADLRDADLRDANLERADLSGANLSRAHLSGTNFHEAIIETTTFATTKLSTAFATVQ